MDHIDKAFREGGVFAADEATLRIYMQDLSNEAVANDYIKHRQIIRSLTINFILTEKLIEKINRQNLRFGLIVGAIAFLSLVAAILQCIAAFMALRQ